ncbi:MAG: hypothetical protein CM1200mP22_33580 [Dehalococcoidia bacterium]|nr:MAG: hypothetical protein CM1200mP22_33580 [Dehalococcoidia bacterium]
MLYDLNELIGGYIYESRLTIHSGINGYYLPHKILRPPLLAFRKIPVMFSHYRFPARYESVARFKPALLLAWSSSFMLADLF